MRSRSDSRTFARIRTPHPVLHRAATILGCEWSASHTHTPRRSLSRNCWFLLGRSTPSKGSSDMYNVLSSWLCLASPGATISNFPMSHAQEPGSVSGKLIHTAQEPPSPEGRARRIYTPWRRVEPIILVLGNGPEFPYENATAGVWRIGLSSLRKNTGNPKTLLQGPKL